MHGIRHKNADLNPMQILQLRPCLCMQSCRYSGRCEHREMSPPALSLCKSADLQTAELRHVHCDVAEIVDSTGSAQVDQLIYARKPSGDCYRAYNILVFHHITIRPQPEEDRVRSPDPE